MASAKKLKNTISPQIKVNTDDYDLNCIAKTLASLSFIKTYSKEITEKSIVVIIPSYNNIKWYEKNLDMVAAQSETYTNWRAIYIDDCSKDGTGDAVEKYITDHNLGNKITLIKNSENHGAMCNLYNVINSCKDNEIIVTLDGDDWFPNNNVLFFINQVYKDENIWITYGQYIKYPNREIGHCEEIPYSVIEKNTFRSYKWVSSHLRTFYAGLFKKIKKEDLMKNGTFYSVAWDLAMIFPMLEMAGKHSKFIDQVLYVYNCTNPISDCVKNSKLVVNSDHEIRAKQKYRKIDSLN